MLELSTGLVKCASTGMSLANVNGGNEGDVAEHWSVPASQNAHGTPGRMLATGVGLGTDGLNVRVRNPEDHESVSVAPVMLRMPDATCSEYSDPGSSGAFGL